MKFALIAAAFAALVSPLMAAEPEAGFTPLFDGKTLDGWKVNESPAAFTVDDGAIRANGARCHLFELHLDVMTRKTSNGGIFIHTTFLDSGWPSGYEIQVNNTQSDPQKSGGLYNTVPNPTPFEDDTWMKYVIIVKDGNVIVRVNDKELVNHTPSADKTKLLPDGGTIAFQAHDPGSTTFYKNIRIKPLD